MVQKQRQKQLVRQVIPESLDEGTSLATSMKRNEKRGDASGGCYTSWTDIWHYATIALSTSSMSNATASCSPRTTQSGSQANTTQERTMQNQLTSDDEDQASNVPDTAYLATSYR